MVHVHVYKNRSKHVFISEEIYETNIDFDFQTQIVILNKPRRHLLYSSFSLEAGKRAQFGLWFKIRLSSF